MLDAGDSKAALALLFDVAEDLEKDARVALKQLTKQLRRVLGHLEAAEDLAEDRLADARARLDQAKAIIKAQGSAGLRFSYGRAGGIDYWRHVMKGANEMRHATTRRILGMVPARPKAKGKR